MKRSPSLAVRIMFGQLLVVALGAATLAITAAVVAPRLFGYHLSLTGENDPHVREHAQQAFDASFAIALTLGVIVSIVGAGILSWILTRRISEPIEHLAAAAEAVAAGDYDVSVPHDAFGPEIAALATSFDDMARKLAATDASRRRLLADLAHELRTPAATLEAHIDGMEDGIVPIDATTYLTMRQQVARLQRLTEDIRTLTEVESHAHGLHPIHLVLADIVEDACQAAQHRYAAKGVHLVNATGPTRSDVNVDPDRIQQVLANLLDNALRFTPPGGTVTLSSTELPGQVDVVVADTGDGIPPAELEAIFDRFHRGDASRHHEGEGSGLGLTIARGIVADHGGTLTATSAGPGLGSQFRLSLPTISAGQQ